MEVVYILPPLSIGGMHRRFSMTLTSRRMSFVVSALLCAICFTPIVHLMTVRSTEFPEDVSLHQNLHLSVNYCCFRSRF